MTGDDVLNLFERLFAAERELALTTHILAQRERELERARGDANDAANTRNMLLQKLQDKAREIAGVGDDGEPDESPREYVPVSNGHLR